MLANLLDRIWSPALLTALVAYVTWAARGPIAPNWTYALLGLEAVWLLKTILFATHVERRLDVLGGRAPSYRGWLPYNLGFIANAVWYFAHHRNHEFWWYLFGNFGNKQRPWTIESITIGDRIILTTDEENIKAILATQFGTYGKGPQFRKEWKDFLGLSIFTTDGDLWHDSRMLLRPQFIKDRVSDLHKFEEHLQILIPLLAGTSPGSTVRADDLFFRFTLDAATDFLLGNSVDSLRNPQVEFAHAFADVQHTQGTIARAGPLRDLVPKKKFKAGLKVLNSFVGKYIDQALALPPEELEKNTKSDEGYTFLHAVAAYTRDRQVLRDQLIAVLLAGRDTTAVTLSWLFYELSRHPEVLLRLRQEIESSIGLNPNNIPTYQDLKSMRYLQHTLNETLRLYPVVPYNVRVALEDTTLPHGGGADGKQPIGVLAGTPVGYSTLVMQRRADIYPEVDSASNPFPDYLAFVPERWDHWTPKSWTYVPFNGGPRICIGQQFALTEMAYTVVRILQAYDTVEDRSGGVHPGFRTDIVLQPAEGVKVAFRRSWEKA